jgi:hypothetical protein
MSATDDAWGALCAHHNSIPADCTPAQGERLVSLYRAWIRLFDPASEERMVPVLRRNVDQRLGSHR